MNTIAALLLASSAHAEFDPDIETNITPNTEMTVYEISGDGALRGLIVVTGSIPAGTVWESDKMYWYWAGPVGTLNELCQQATSTYPWPAFSQMEFKATNITNQNLQSSACTPEKASVINTRDPLQDYGHWIPQELTSIQPDPSGDYPVPSSQPTTTPSTPWVLQDQVCDGLRYEVHYSTDGTISQQSLIGTACFDVADRELALFAQGNSGSWLKDVTGDHSGVESYVLTLGVPTGSDPYKTSPDSFIFQFNNNNWPSGQGDPIQGVTSYDQQ